MNCCWHSPVAPEAPHRDDRPSRPLDDAVAAVAVLLLVWCVVLGARALVHEARHAAEAVREHIALTDR